MMDQLEVLCLYIPQVMMQALVRYDECYKIDTEMLYSSNESHAMLDDDTPEW